MKIKKIVFFLLIIISTIIVIEFVFRNFVATISERPTLVRSTWLKKYWWPINNMGYRDYDHYLGDLKNKKNIIIVGDSITAGFGIKDYRDRYPNILQEKLGNEWQIINISVPGWNLQQKVSATCSYPYINEVKLIIFQYYFDDLVPEWVNYCGKPPVTDADWLIPESYSYYLIRKSYFINYVYWRLYEFTFLFRKDILKEYLSYLDCVKENKENTSMDAFNRLKDLIGLCEKNKIKLVILNIPHLELFENIRNKTNNSWEDMHMIFVKNNIPTIDITSQYNHYKTLNLRVNLSDCHPNEKAHRIIADFLFDELTKMNLITALKTNK